MPTLNQEETRKNIIRLRGTSTKKEAAKTIDVAYNYYIGIESGTNPINNLFVKKVSEGYGVAVNEIAVYDNEYEKGYYDGIKNVHERIDMEFDEIKNKAVIFNYEITEDIKHGQILYAILSKLGYRLKTVEINDTYKGYSSEEQMRLRGRFAQHSGHVFALFKRSKLLCYWSIGDYTSFENFIYSAITGYINEMIKDYKRQLSNTVCEKDKAVRRDSLEELKADIKDIKRLVSEFERIVEDGEERAKSERDGDDLQTKG